MTITTTVLNSTVATSSTPIWFPVRDITLSEWCIVVSFALILSTGVLGNAFVIYVFGYKRKSNRRSTTELLIFYLGIIDFLSSLLNPPLYIYWTLTNYRRWDFGYLGCQIIPSLGPIMTSASCGVLLIIAVDRYIAIVAPFSGELTPKTVTIVFFFDIVVSICFYLHYILALRIHPKYKYCFVPDVADYKYGIPNCVFVVLRLCLFATVFSFTNVKIFETLRQCNGNSTSKEIRVQRLKQSKRIMGLLVTMGLVFTFLVFPRELFYLVYNLSWMVSKNGVKFNSTLYQINSWLKVAHTANSCANVFIYSHMQIMYRKQIMRVFAYFGCCKKTFSHQSFSITFTSFMRDKSRASLRKTKKEFKKILLIDNEDSISSGDAVFFQRAQQWKKRQRYDSMFLL